MNKIQMELLFIVLLLGVLIWSAVHKERVVMKEGFQAWVKQTGNPSHLTYDEWRALWRTQGRPSDIPVVIIGF